MKQSFIKFGVIGLILYLLSTGVSFAAFRMLVPNNKDVPEITQAPTPVKPQARFTMDASIPRTEVCPLNGMMYTKQEKEVWDTRRPLAVMIENHEEARPQSGLSRADIVYEAIAEGGITRFMGVFYCGASAGSLSLAPVRSARIYYLPWVLEYDALYNHVGGAGRCEDDTVDDRAKALCRINQWKIKDMDQFGISFPTCYRNYDRLGRTVATEHTMVCVTDKLYDLAAKKDWTNVDAKGVSWEKNFKSWKFVDGKSVGDSQTIEYAASSDKAAAYGVRWVYNKELNSYDRFTGGQPHKDLETEEQLSPKVVVIQFAKYQVLPDPTEVVHLHSYYENIGTGNALVFQNGEVIEAKWSKKDKSARTLFTDSKGKEIEFVRGQIWIDMLPTGTNVTY